MPDYSTKAPGVYLEEVSGVRPIGGVGTATAAFIGLASKGPDRPTLVTNWTQFVDLFGGISEGMSLGPAVYAYLANGGSASVIVRVGGDTEAPTTASATVMGATGDAFVATATASGTGGNGVSIEVIEQDTDHADTPADADAPPASEIDSSTPFDLAVRGPDGQEELFESVTVGSLLTQLAGSALVTVTAPSSKSVARPTSGQTSLSGGTDGDSVSAEAFLGNEEERTGLAGLIAEDEVTMVAAPDLVTALARGSISTEAVAAVQSRLIDHCEQLKDRMAILDPPFSAPDGLPGKPMSAQECLAWRDALPSSKFAAVYYPWTTVYDVAAKTSAHEPPSAFVAGAWARNDAEFGVGSAPTGRLRHATGLARQVTDAEQGILNPRGVNCLRVFRGSGPVIWGARTLSDDSEWRYLNVRRLFNFIEESIVEGTKFAVFAPNDRDLWARLKRSVEAFLLGLWRDGALVGTTADQAFFVQCNEETNPRDLVDQGIVTVEIGAAPVKPAEFVIIRVRQSSDGSAVSE